MKIKKMLVVVVLLALSSLVLSCKNTDSNDHPQIKAADLMSGIVPNKPDGKAVDSLFVEKTAGFFVELFKHTLGDKQNALISPVSVLLALSMTANGADNNTLSQMEHVLGGGIPLAELNRYLYAYVHGLPNEAKSKLHIANSIWFRDGFHVKKDFLQVNANYYAAKAYQSAFDEETLKDINLWVKLNTDGMIDTILDKIQPGEVMYLINAVAFEAEWQKIYDDASVQKNEFTNIHGKKQTVDFLSSRESFYLEDEHATGFIKPYMNNKYSFVALLPHENISIEAYIRSLSGAGFINTLQKAQQAGVSAQLPKFSYQYSISMKEALKTLGMPEAFEPEKADFSKIAHPPPNLFLSRVLHKSFIDVNERGTKAGAVTAVGVAATAAPPPEKHVVLNRPFVYAIVDNATKLPLFMGVLASVE